MQKLTEESYNLPIWEGMTFTERLKAIYGKRIRYTQKTGFILDGRPISATALAQMVFQ
jgi:hypothetical protein